MTGPSSSAVVALFDLATAHVLEVLADVEDTALGRPTPCAGWDVRALVLHLADSADTLDVLRLTGRFDDAAPARQEDAVPVKAAQERILQLRDGVLSSTPLTCETGPAGSQEWAILAAQAGVLEFTTHAWDVAAACGRDLRLPDDLAGQALRLARALIGEDGRAPRFAPPLDVPPTAASTDRLVAHLGRNPQWRSRI